MKVSWDDDIPNINGIIKIMFQTTNQELVNIPLLIGFQPSFQVGLREKSMFNIWVCLKIGYIPNDS